MLHYVHQLVSNWVCLLSGAEQVVKWIVRALPPSADENDERWDVKKKQNYKMRAGKLNKEPKDAF